MSYLNVNELAKTESLRARITVAIVHYAGTVLTATRDGSMQPAEYNKRVDYARNAIRDPAGLASAFIWPVLSNTTIAEKGLDTTDDELLYQIGQVWNVLAGVTAEDTQPQ